jgi:hypothetical protein
MYLQPVYSGCINPGPSKNIGWLATASPISGKIFTNKGNNISGG